jgi:hypothetical protein
MSSELLMPDDSSNNENSGFYDISETVANINIGKTFRVDHMLEKTGSMAYNLELIERVICRAIEMLPGLTTVLGNADREIAGEEAAYNKGRAVTADNLNLEDYGQYIYKLNEGFVSDIHLIELPVTSPIRPWNN